MSSSVGNLGPFAIMQVRQQLLDAGVCESGLLAMSAASGQGVADVVRRVRSMLDDLGPAVVEYETDAVNRTSTPGRLSTARLDDFAVEVCLSAAAAAG